jgi:hypothetical protein
MKLTALFLLLSNAFALSVPTYFIDTEQSVLQVSHEYPGFQLDFDARRLIQMDGTSPVWMTESDKVYISQIRSFFG